MDLDFDGDFVFDLLRMGVLDLDLVRELDDGERDPEDLGVIGGGGDGDLFLMSGCKLLNVFVVVYKKKQTKIKNQKRQK